jgi:hypothetical protein
VLDADVGRHRRRLERLRFEQGEQEEGQEGEALGQDELEGAPDGSASAQHSQREVLKRALAHLA